MKKDRKQKLWELCERFIEEQDITSGECIYQSDRVIENAYEFIEDVCEIAGYKPFEDA
jgi:hypothetical protein